MTDLLLNSSTQLIDLGTLILRLSLGICFVVHGLGKLGVVGPGSMSGFVSWLESLNVPFAPVQARIAMLSELSGGCLIAVGFLTRPGAMLLCATMVVASLIGHRGGGYLITNDPPGNEYTINLACLMIVLILTGPGRYSLDAYIFG